MAKKEFFSSLCIFILLASLICLPMFLKGMALFPGNYLTAWFEPYKSENFKHGAILIAHKPVADDVFRHIYPFKILAVDMLKHFQLPLWSPYNGAGMPLLATVNSGLIDPFNLLFLIWPYLTAWNLYLFLQFLFIGFFTYLYTRKLYMSMFASYFAAIAFLFSAVVITRVSLGAYGMGIAMLPLLLFVFESYLQNYTTRVLFFVPFAVFTLITSTHPQISFYILLLSACYVVIRIDILSKSFKERCKLLFSPTVFLLLGFLLSAIQIIPTIELLQYSNFTTQTSSYVTKFLVPWYHIVSIGIPNYFGNAATYNFWGTSDYIETAAAIGLLPCFFAYLAFFSKLNSTKKIFFITFISSLLLAIDSPISHFFLALPIPILSTDPPSRIFLITTFSLAILSGYGFDIWMKNKWSVKEKITITMPFLLIILSILVITTVLYKKFSCSQPNIPCYQVAFRNTLLEIGIFATGFLLFFLYNYWGRTQIKIVIASLLLILLASIGWYNAEKFLPFSPKTTVLPSSPLFQQITKLNQQERVFGLGDATITTNLATYFRFYDPQYYHPLYNKRYGELTAFANYGKPNTNVLRSDAVIRNEPNVVGADDFRRQRLFGLLNISYLIFNKQQVPIKPNSTVVWQNNLWYIQKNPSALPRAFIVNQIVVQKNKANILQTLFSKTFNPAHQVILEQNPHLGSPQTRQTSRVVISNYQENAVTMKTQTSKPGILVLLDNDYPGWNAYIDGKRTQVYRADYTFRAIVLPKGRHTIEFIYQPISIIISSIFSITAAILIILLYLTYPFFIKNLSVLQKITA